MAEKLRLKPEFMAAYKVQDLARMFSLPYVSSQGYDVAPKPKLRLRPKLLGGSTPLEQVEAYVSQSINELMSRVIV